jgi:hypothetical protein
MQRHPGFASRTVVPWRIRGHLVTPRRPTVTLAAIVIVAATVIALPITADRASAVSIRKPPKPIECQAMASGPSSATTVNVCDRRRITGSSGSLTSCPTGQCITWATGKGFHLTYSYTVPKTSRCSPGLIEVDTVGKVVSATGAGTKPFIGATVTYDACLTNQINVIQVGLVPGTFFTIG